MAIILPHLRDDELNLLLASLKMTLTIAYAAHIDEPEALEYPEKYWGTIKNILNLTERLKLTTKTLSGKFSPELNNLINLVENYTCPCCGYGKPNRLDKLMNKEKYFS